MNWADYLDWGAREDSGKPLVYCNGVVTTYGEMRLWANRIGNVLAGLGVAKGDRVATFLPTTSLHEAVLLGSLKLGAIGCTLPIRERSTVVIDLLRTLEAKVLVVCAESAEFACEARREFPELAILVAGGSVSGFPSLDEYASAASTELETIPMRDSEVAFIAFTGGTTGRPKGVQVTARMLRAQNYAFYERLSLGRSSEVFFGTISFSHVGGLVITMALAFTAGASHVLLPKWDPLEAFKLVERHRVTCLSSSTTLVQQMARCAEFLTTDWLSLKICSVGGESVPVELKERWLRVTGAPLTRLSTMNKPTIAAVDGPAVSAGFTLALACDMRVASEKARFHMVMVKRGLIPDIGGTYFLPRIVGMAKACEIVFVADPIGAKEALEMGLVNSVVPSETLMKKVMEMANKIARNSSLAVEAAKLALYKGAVEPNLLHHVRYEFYANRLLLDGEDFREGFMSFLEKREAKFTGKWR